MTLAKRGERKRRETRVGSCVAAAACLVGALAVAPGGVAAAPLPAVSGACPTLDKVVTARPVPAGVWSQPITGGAPDLETPWSVTGVRQHALAPDGNRLAMTSFVPMRPALDLPWPESPTSLVLSTLDGSSSPKIVAAEKVTWMQWSPTGNRLAFTDTADYPAIAGTGLHIVNADGSGRVNLGAVSRPPVWSPNGQRLAYADATGLHLLTADGSAAPVTVPITNAYGHGVAWSPDSGRVAVATTPTNSLVVVDVATTANTTLVPAGSAAASVLAQWSPDSSSILFTGPDVGTTTPNRARVIPADGSGPAVVVSGAGVEVAASSVWSPTGSRVLWTRGSPSHLYSSNPDGSSPVDLTAGITGEVGRFDTMVTNVVFAPDEVHLATVARASGKDRIVVSTVDGSEPPVLSIGDPGEIMAASFSGDGTRIVWGTRVGLGESSPRLFQEAVTGVGGPIELGVAGGLNRVGESPTSPWSLVAGPGGDRVVFAPTTSDTQYGAGTDLWTFHPDLRAVPTAFSPHPTTPDLGVRASPDRRSLAWGSGNELWVARSDGSGARQIDIGDAQGITVYNSLLRDSNPLAWSPDGQWLAWVDVVHRVYTVRADGSAPAVRLSTVAGLPTPGLAWAPDSASLAWAHHHAATARQEVFQATPGVLASEVPTGLAGSAVAWSPDGTRWAVANGTSVQFVAVTPGAVPVSLGTFPAGLTASALRWSPDGSRVAAWTSHAYVYGGVGFRDSRLAMFSTTGGAVRDMGNGEDPVWAPNGTRMAYEQSRVTFTSYFGVEIPTTDNHWLWTAAPDGSSRVRSVRGADPIWAPDSSAVAVNDVVLPVGGQPRPATDADTWRFPDRVVVNALADLGVGISLTPPVRTPEGKASATLTLSASNAGPCDVHGAMVTLSLAPAAMAAVTGAVPNALVTTSATGGQSVSFSIQDLLAGTAPSVSVDIVYQDYEAGQVAGIAITSATPDLNLANNQASLVLPPVPPA